MADNSDVVMVGDLADGWVVQWVQHLVDLMAD